MAAGAEIAKAGFALWNGGYKGTMEATAKGAAEVGGTERRGYLVSALFPHRDAEGNPYLSERVEAATLLGRIGGMTEGVRYVLVLPGTVGTLTELCVAWNLAALAGLRDAEAPIKIYAYRKPWEGVLAGVVEGLGIGKDHAGLITYVDSAKEAVGLIAEDFEAASRSSSSP